MWMCHLAKIARVANGVGKPGAGVYLCNDWEVVLQTLPEKRNAAPRAWMVYLELQQNQGALSFDIHVGHVIPSLLKCFWFHLG